MATAGIIVIGNEILSGKVVDLNANYLIRELRALGVDLMGISVIPDQVDLIAEEMRRFSARYDYVFTSGGVGPTHDDVTFDGLAKAFDAPLALDPTLEAGMRHYFGDKLNEAHLKMARLPQGSELVASGHRSFPVVKFRNLYILPGIPKAFVAKFESIKERFRGQPIHLRKLYVKSSEEEIAAHLNETVAQFSDLLLGSYPQLGIPEYRVILTLESRDEACLSRALADLKARLGDQAIHAEE